MLNKIIGFSVRNKLIIGLFTIALICVGVYETTKLPIDAVPDITDNQVQIITVAPSYGATDIERLVTFPIEQENSNIKGIKEIRSFSRFGLSLVTIVFNDWTDIYWARQQVTERLQRIQSQIPTNIGVPEMGPISTGLGEIYQYVVRAKEGYESRYDETELRTIQDWIVRRQLLGVKGVAEVSSFGGKLKQYEIAISTNKLQSLNVTIDDVFNALEQNNQNTGGAYIEKGPTLLFIRSEGLIGNMNDIENILVKATSSGTPILIRDVGEVKIGHATRYGAMCYNDKGEVSGAIVMMLKGANSSEVIKNVKERIAQIQKTLPEGVVIEPFLDRTKMVNNAISTVEKNLLEGALIVVFILVLFLGNLRAGLLVASVIPLSMLFAIIMMNLFGVSGNLMSLGALDFGLIVDGAVIIVEAVMHQLSHNKKFASVTKLSQPQMDEEVNVSASRMMNSAVFGQIIILIVYLPILTLQGIEGKMFKPMAQTVAFALIGAFLLSLTYIPMMSALALSKKVHRKENFSDKMMRWAERLHKKYLVKALRIPKTILAITVGLFALSLVTFSFMGGEFIPALEEGDFAVDTRVLTGSNLNTTIEYTQKAAHVLLEKFPEVEKVVTKIGSGEVPTDPMPIEASDMMVILKDKKEWTSATSFPELAEKMSEALRAVPGISTGFQYPVQMRFNELMTGARQDVVCKIFGEDLDTLAHYAHQMGRIIDRVEGVRDLYIETITGMPQIVVKYHRNTIAQYGLNIEDINRVIRTAFAGQSAGKVFEGEKRFDLVVRLDETLRTDATDVENLLIPTPSGNQIPLHQLASISIQNGPNQIQREDAKRRIVVGFNVRGRDVQSIVQEVQQKVEKQLGFPAGYYVTYGGAFENLNEAKQRLLIAVPVSLLLIFLLLYFAFGSVKHSLLIYSAIPLSAIGGIFFLALRGMPFSISAGVGFIALFGVAVLNGIVLIAEFNRLKKSGMEDLEQIVLQGARTRLRPVLMTAMVASLGFLPMALSNGAGAEVQRPLATVVIGGLLLATLLTLFVLPLLYVLFEKKSNRKSGAGVAMLLVFLFVPFISGSQTITLQQAIDTALHNNLTLKNQQLVTAYRQQLKRTAFDMPQANATAEFGQINSAYTDNRIGISQSLSFPTVYSRQRKLQHEEWQNAVLTTRLTEAEIRKNTTEIFYHILVLREKQKLLNATDSLYAEFVRRAKLRFEKGATNIIEKTSAETQRGQIHVQLSALEAEINVSKLLLQLLMNGSVSYEPYAKDLKAIYQSIFDTSILAHPVLKIQEQQQRIAVANLKLERAKLLPELGVGFYSQTLRGTGADDVVYDATRRFSAGQIGVGIPLFFGAQQSRISAAKIQVNLAENSYLLRSMLLQTELQTALIKYQNSSAMLTYLESTQLPNARIITENVWTQFTAGEINYLEWVMLNNQALELQNAYLDALDRYNNDVSQLIYITTK
ncbi:MAG TPA: CusA/CzcA family heavy metal efflux RND transporter [Flavipsychrobacter sp.]|nr:CusA/CzcA family heavy metal efflux RND transporter [Flavipsychrobacter sp.]